MDNMELIITEKNIAAQQISRLLAQGGKPETDKVYNTPVYRFNRDGHECVAIGLKGHILGLDFPQELIYKKKTGWVGLEEDGEVIDAPDVPKELPTPPWKSKRRPYIPEGINLKGWKIPSLPYLTYAPIVKLPAEKDIIRSLKNLAKKADEIVIATDFDREGELIGLDAISVVREVNETAPITRSRYSAFVKKEIEEGVLSRQAHDARLRPRACGRDAPVHRPHLGCRAHALPHLREVQRHRQHALRRPCADPDACSRGRAREGARRLHPRGLLGHHRQCRPQGRSRRGLHRDACHCALQG